MHLKYVWRNNFDFRKFLQDLSDVGLFGKNPLKVP